MIDEKKLIEIANKFTFTDKTQERQYKDFLKYCVDNTPKVGEWTLFECREADEEEKESYGWEEVLCCKLPDEDEEILVSYASGYVDTDIFLRDGTECYLESGAEFVTEDIAWMPKPKAYEG